MSTNIHFVEKTQVQPSFMPVNMATGANAGAWFDMKMYGRCAVIFCAGVGTAAQDPTITLSQATTVSGTSTKALNFTRIDRKEATALSGVGTFTTTTQAAANTYTTSGSANEQKLWVIDIKAEDLDIQNGFCCVQASVSDVGTNSQIGVCLYIGHEPREMSKTLPTPIAN